MRSAAPLEGRSAAPDIARDMNYQTSIQSGGAPEVLKDKLTPKAIVAALNDHIVGHEVMNRILVGLDLQ